MPEKEYVTNTHVMPPAGRSTTAPNEASRPAWLAPGDHAPTVLIVEDDDAAAELMGRELARHGTRMVTTRSVSDALRLLQKRSFKAILLDYQLPGGDPWAVVEVAASVRPAIPVILVTGRGSEVIAAEAVRWGVADYVIKTELFWTLLPAILDRVMKLAANKQRLRDSG